MNVSISKWTKSFRDRPTDCKKQLYIIDPYLNLIIFQQASILANDKATWKGFPY